MEWLVAFLSDLFCCGRKHISRTVNETLCLLQVPKIESVFGLVHLQPADDIAKLPTPKTATRREEGEGGDQFNRILIGAFGACSSSSNNDDDKSRK